MALASLITGPARVEVVHAIQRELFGPSPKGLLPTPPTPEALQRLVMGITDTHLSEQFSFWIVGSTLRKGHRAADLDLLMTRRDDRRITVAGLEHVLCEVHRIGRYQARVQLDACFRNTYRDELGGIFGPDHLVKTWRLESPHIGAAFNHGRLGHARRVGRCLVLQFQAADQTNYFCKLPPAGSSQKVRLLPPGVPIETCFHHFKEHAGQRPSWPPGFAMGTNPSLSNH